MITSVVGSGGKTTLIHQLAEAYKKEQKKVLITTTTHMAVEADTLVTDDPALILEALAKNGYAFVGAACEDKGKICALSRETFLQVITAADEVLIEADGSKRLPLKYPNDTEPVIYPETDQVIVVTSLLALGKPAEEVIHRLPLALACLQESLEEHGGKHGGITHKPTCLQESLNGTRNGVTPEIVQILLRKGYLEPMSEKSFQTSIKVTNDGSLYQRALAALIQADMDVSLLDENWFAKKPCLFLCGAGHVAEQVAYMASILDFEIKVMDSRENLATKQHFPGADQVICESFDHLTDHLTEDSYYVVVTPGHQDDYTCVKQILGSSYAYLGMIGSRKKIAATYERLRGDGFTQEQIDTIHAPIGLSIGAVTPAEIAVSILAEIIEIKNKSSAASISTELLHTRESGTLCIIINKTGSAPRGIGSMMLVTKDGQIDTIGGGSMEHRVLEEARTITAPCIKEYDLSPADVTKLGMICGGTNTVLFLPI